VIHAGPRHHHVACTACPWGGRRTADDQVAALTLPCPRCAAPVQAAGQKGVYQRRQSALYARR
jgi:hypothetical protein